ncbi:MAG: hypothetical protein ACPGN6_06325 [Gammaproteobacteria bacterium]|jgi:hypothetical protein
MSLANRLDDIRQASAGKIPPNALKAMQMATEELRNSGIMGGIVKAGDIFPSFSLRNQNDKAITSQELLSNGPIVFTIFRGHW